MGSGNGLNSSNTYLPPPQLELERKFLVDSSNIAPDLMAEIVSVEIISQCYLLITKSSELRIRSRFDGINFKYSLDYKQGEGRDRVEISIDLSEEEFHFYTLLTKGLFLEKLRTTIKYDNIIINIDRFYHDAFFVLAEVEFNSFDEANRFSPPDWFDEEVTYVEEYKNKNIWKTLVGGISN